MLGTASHNNANCVGLIGTKTSQQASPTSLQMLRDILHHHSAATRSIIEFLFSWVGNVRYSFLSHSRSRYKEHVGTEPHCFRGIKSLLLPVVQSRSPEHLGIVDLSRVSNVGVPLSLGE